MTEPINAVTGHAVFKCGGVDYVVRYGFEAYCAIEESMAEPLPQVLTELASGKPRLRLLGRVFYAGLREHHPEVTERLAGELIMQAGIPTALKAIENAIRASFPQAEEGASPGNGGEDPTTAAARGNGADSLKEQSPPA